MADAKISALPAASAAASTDEFPANQSGTTRKVTGAQLATLIGGGGGARSFGILIYDSGSVIAAGIKGYVRIPVACTITKWTLLSTDSAGPATAGSIVVDVWKDSYANYPPTVADTITASAKPTLSGANKAESSTLTGWTTSLSAGDVVGFKVDSAATLTRVLLQLEVSVP